MFEIRPFHLSDLTALYRICLLTGDNGADATPLHEDLDLLGHLYAAPYAVLAPELCFVLTKASVPIGYVLGVSDSAEFAQACEQHWFPPLRTRYPLPPDDDSTPDATLVHYIHEGRAAADLPDYPAHLHIDILPVGQGVGFGRKLLHRFFAKLRDCNIAGVHLGVSRNNLNAIGFYEQIGFERLLESPSAIIFGMRL